METILQRLSGSEESCHICNFPSDIGDKTVMRPSTANVFFRLRGHQPSDRQLRFDFLFINIRNQSGYKGMNGGCVMLHTV